MTSDNAQPVDAAKETGIRRVAAGIAGFLRRAWPFAVTALVTLALILLYRMARPPIPPLTPPDIETIAGELIAEITPAPPFSASVYETILPSMVLIRTGSAGLPGDRSADNRDDHTYPVAFDSAISRNGSFLNRPQTVQDQQPRGYGAGVVVSAEGAILTAYHVIEGSPGIEVVFADGTETPATIAAIEPDNNIAVLIPETLPELFAPAVLGSPGALRVGDEAYVVGNPFGLAGSMSAGVISGFDRSYRLSSDTPPLQRLIQFDAAVNPGNAGGPLLNRNGEVVGIIVGPANPGSDTTFIGIGFAVRIDVAGAAAGAPPQ